MTACGGLYSNSRHDPIVSTCLLVWAWIPCNGRRQARNVGRVAGPRACCRTRLPYRAPPQPVASRAGCSSTRHATAPPPSFSSANAWRRRSRNGSQRRSLIHSSVPAKSASLPDESRSADGTPAACRVPASCSIVVRWPWNGSGNISTRRRRPPPVPTGDTASAVARAARELALRACSAALERQGEDGDES
ncbi:hypothetical protein GQ55_3G172900 [Panicum hallii var. hallii]|uniref:Uncharacterized protein n=1 Tax=Panicum hallii var. hallii TaxID=1504633 RepID=A0A2T7EAG2_9POAL|nr:hypothetical protein GQ55_3G172900 [Panicum hallii var. hallii]